MLNQKDTIVLLIVRLTKKDIVIKMSYFSPYSYSKNKTEVELDLPNYATKSDLKTQQMSIHHNLLKKMA